MLDKDLRPEHIQSISNATEVAGFFSYLGYNTSERITQSPANLGITNETLLKEIKKVELIANQENLLQVYLFELSSVTIANTQAFVRVFRNRVGNYLMVLTSDFNRIDFVLIERVLPDDKTEGIGIKQASIRPRILTVDRLKPTRIDQRVLRRFSYTETDPIAQYEKLQAAYIVADWSEEFFNNRALFSDYYLLAIGLDLLARDEDEKTFKRVFIDYKSLGVRHLGSIYEGLLEFHLRIAPEKMAICKGKKTEEIIPYKEAIKQKKKILTTGRGKNAVERLLSKGAVYLENTKHERKATGSYYTPDYIVKYIVENTVGPVLKEKFEVLTPKFREAQWAYREAVSRAKAFEKKGMKGDNPEKTAFTFKWLVDDLFDVKVLDPAMGSGHFLVETVDFLTDKMIDFLNGFPWNPVMATLKETRETILKEMEKQNITIDETRLNDLNLLKRHVLKRCIYGVDLNLS
jgi:hypothetical protein